jgi:methylglyoxal synthase
MNQSNYFKDIKRIALVASPDTRKDLIEWSYSNKNILKNHIIISTARTATILEGTLNTPVLNLHHGKSGGYEQIKSLLEENKLDMIIFFGYHLVDEHKDSWFDELVRTAIRQDIVVAYNQSTIDMLMTSIAIRHEDSIKENHHHRFLHQQIEKENKGINNVQL